MTSYLTVSEVALRIRESEDQVRRRCATGQLKATKLGSKWRIAEEAVAEFMRPGTRVTPRKRLTARQERQLGVSA